MTTNKDIEISVLKGDKLFNENTPFIININTKKLKTAKKMSNADLICVIDISTSMKGQKLNLVKKSLIILVKMMDKDDRLSLVLFSNCSEILFDLDYMTEERKSYVISKINDIKVTYDTNILSGLENAINILKKIQKEKNDKRASSILLLSDGCDNYSYNYSTLSTKFKKLYQGLDLNFTLNTFGYGNNHDPNIMNGLANLRDGSFFYVEDYKKVAEYFVTVLGGCVSIISKNVKINIKLLNENCTIKKVFGVDNLYKYNIEPHIFKTEIIQLLCDQEYTYVLELNFDEKKIKKNSEIIYVEVIYNDMSNNNNKNKITFIYKNINTKKTDKNKANEEYIRSQVYYVLDEALKLREKNKIKEANDLLSNMEDWIKKNYKGNNKFYLEDIIKSKNIFKDEEEFNIKGVAFAKSNIKQKMCKKVGAGDMYKNCNMDYYCNNMNDDDILNNDDYDYDKNDNYNGNKREKKIKNIKKDEDYNENNFDPIDYINEIDDCKNICSSNIGDNYYNNNEDYYYNNDDKNKDY